MFKFTALIGVMVLFGLTACEKKDDRFPAYYRYKLEVKVDGTPVTLDRVVKCTGVLTKDAGNPSTWGGNIYSNPPVIGAKVPGSSAAVFVPVPGACGWAAEFKGKQWQEPPIKPGDVMPLLLVNDRKTFSNIEYYVSKSNVSGELGNVQFVQLYPLERVSDADFQKSENRAATESPNISPFLSPINEKKLKSQLSENPDFTKNIDGGLSIVCVGAWQINRQEWSAVPGITDWVHNLPKDGFTHRLPSSYWISFNEIVTINKGNTIAKSMIPIEVPSEKQRQKGGRFSTFDTLHPVIFASDTIYVDLERKGLGGCFDQDRFPNRAISNQSNYPTKNAAEQYQAPYAIIGNKLEVSLFSSQPFYVPELSSFLIFNSLPTPGGQISEQIELGVN